MNGKAGSNGPDRAEFAEAIKMEDVAEPLFGLLRKAISEHASDLHIDPTHDGMEIRYRVDGELRSTTPMVHELGERLLNQIKVAANLKLDRSHTPLEGMIILEEGDSVYDLRVTIAPVLNREAAHMRFISADWRLEGLDELGFEKDELNRITQSLAAGSGLTLVAGATGSGKTTTLYALTNSLDLKETVGASIEDPVEFRLDGLRQLEVDEEYGMTMSEGLRSLLRMDPDVIVVGEIRDHDSAVIAARAALSGRMVMATIHAPDSAAAVLSLENLGVPRHILGGALRLIIVQDLAPRLCPKCREEKPLSEDLVQLYKHHKLPVPEFEYRKNGCDACNGYGVSGRIGLFEVVAIDKNLSHEISAGISQRELARRIRETGAKSIVHDALEKAAKGCIGAGTVRKLALTHRSLESD